MSGSRMKDANWSIEPGIGGGFSLDAAILATLMDVRDELKSLNALLHRPNFTGIPTELRAIRRNTTKKRPRTKK